MRTWIVLAVIGSCLAADKGQRKAEEQALRKFISERDAAWNRHEPDPGEAYAVDADFVNSFGGWVSGREEFGKLIKQLHAGPFHNQTVQTTIERIHFIRPDVAIVIAKRAYRTPDKSSESRALYILTKQGGKWIGQAFQNTVITDLPEDLQKSLKK
jgi:uncharacterized protein (TIGR02246 family)